MDFGMFTMYMVREGAPQIEAFREWMKLIELAEEVGLDSVWLGETHFRPQRAVLASPLVVAGAVAARTSNINVGIAVQVLPLANPVRVAEEAAMIDHMSEGRLVFGVGRSSFLESYQGYNIDYGESRSRYFESLEIILRAWGEEPFSFEGEFYNFQNVNVVPKPFQKPHPPIRVAVESRDTFRMIGSSGYPIFIRHQMSIAELQNLLSEYQGTRHAAGFDGPNDVIVQIPAYVAETAERAFEDPRASTMRGRRLVLEAINETADEEAYERLKALSEVPYDRVVDRTAYGTPEAVVDRLQMYIDELGATGFSLDFNPGGQIPHELIVNSMRLFGEKVVPNFR
jgi:alkanesulfonate monooxygenase SsuD/methylene tetrahydromethanopterin reductase-like flavin-dependent oxidoreductase (luciferase family)